MKTKPAKIVGIVSYLAGLIMIVAGVATWAVVSVNLNEQRITVAADSPMLAGATVGDPFTAYAQAQIINTHAEHATDGKTYAELGAEQAQVRAEAEAAGIKDITLTDPAVVVQDQAASPQYTELKNRYQALTAQRTTAMNASFLRASLFTSVVAYGVAALVVALGIWALLVGWALRGLASAPAPAVVRPATDTAAEDAGAV